MKKLLIGLGVILVAVAAYYFISTSQNTQVSNNTNTLANENVNESMNANDDEKNQNEDEIQKDEESQTSEESSSGVKSIDNVEIAEVLTSSVLEDSTNTGFNYVGEQVTDADFSTAWCPDGSAGEEITIGLTDFVQTERVGIVPGFARDKTIYFQNNRVKTLKIYFAYGFDGFEEDTNSDNAPMTVELKDEYAMQFIDLDGRKFNRIKFVVDDVYAGSKYKDTCISEIDFHSDYVKNKDADAAMKYYETEKKPNALRPFDIVGAVYLSDVKPGTCQSPVKPTDDYASDYLPYGDVYVSAVINQYGKKGDVLTYKISKLPDIRTVVPHMESLDALYEPVDSGKISVIEDCKGNLYAHLKYDPQGYPTRYRVDFYHEGKYVARTEFVLGQ